MPGLFLVCFGATLLLCLEGETSLITEATGWPRSLLLSLHASKPALPAYLLTYILGSPCTAISLGWPNVLIIYTSASLISVLTIAFNCLQRTSRKSMRFICQAIICSFNSFFSNSLFFQALQPTGQSWATWLFCLPAWLVLAEYQFLSGCYERMFCNQASSCAAVSAKCSKVGYSGCLCHSAIYFW